MNVLVVTGSRHGCTPSQYKELRREVQACDCVLSGGGDGVDTQAQDLAVELGKNLHRVTLRLRGAVPACWLTMSTESRNECRRALFTHMRDEYIIYRASSDAQLVTVIKKLDLADSVRRWRMAELAYKIARERGNPRAFFAE